MMGKTKIEWAETVWNPVSGCSKVSEGCRNCYAERMAKQLAGRFGYPKKNPFAVTLHYERLADPLGWRRPRRVFVCSMSDLFHPSVPDRFIGAVWFAMQNAPQPGHVFMVLTKRPERMAELTGTRTGGEVMLPLLPNVWLGVSVEDQPSADERIPHVLRCRAAKWFVSCEPALGPVTFPSVVNLPRRICGDWPIGHDTRADAGLHVAQRNPQGAVSVVANNGHHLGLKPDEFEDRGIGVNWIIAGGESGPKARPAHPDWFRSVRDQCHAAGVPFFMKQWGEWRPVPLSEQVNGHEEALRPDGTRSIVGVHLMAAAMEKPGYALMRRVGKKAAGRLLDGHEHSAFPQETDP